MGASQRASCVMTTIVLGAQTLKYCLCKINTIKYQEDNQLFPFQVLPTWPGTVPLEIFKSVCEDGTCCPKREKIGEPIIVYEDGWVTETTGAVRSVGVGKLQWAALTEFGVCLLAAWAGC